MSSVEIGEGQILAYSEVFSSRREKVVVFLHGIMGSKKNLRTFVQKFVDQHEDVYAIIFDLPNHGESMKQPRALSIFECAEAIERALKTLGLKPYAFVGHSYGAKVALLCAQRFLDVHAVFMLDASPGIADVAAGKRADSFDTLALIHQLGQISWPVKSRQSLVDLLMKGGVPERVSLWMTTNLENAADGLRLVFDPAIIRGMLENFFVTDLWPVVYEVGSRAQVHMVAAQYGGRLSQSDAQKLAVLPKNKGFFHQLPNSGHFLHTDNPQGLLAILKPFF